MTNRIIVTPEDCMNCSGVSLHDARFQKIRIEKDKIIFDFDTLYLIDGEEEIWKSGSIVFEEVDFDYCDIMLYCESKSGKIKGKRYSFAEFLMKYPEYEFEVVDEGYYGYKVKWDGVANYTMKAPTYFHLSIFHLGNMVIEI